MRAQTTSRWYLLLALVMVTSAMLYAPAVLALEGNGNDDKGQVIDRIVAVVNGEVLTLGQLQRALSVYESNRLAGLAGGCDLTGSSDAIGRERREMETLDCLIDSLLVFQYVRRFPQVDVTSSAISTEFQDLAATFASRQEFETEMQRWGFSNATLRRALERQLIVESYVESRFREFVDISQQRITEYYEETLAAEMQRLGEPLPALESVSDPITAILREEEVNRRIDEWIVELRERAEILTYLW
jgi:hypothetical protein